VLTGCHAAAALLQAALRPAGRASRFEELRVQAVLLTLGEKTKHKIPFSAPRD